MWGGFWTATWLPGGSLPERPASVERFLLRLSETSAQCPMFTRISLLASDSSDKRIRKNQRIIHGDVLFHRVRVVPQIFPYFSQLERGEARMDARNASVSSRSRYPSGRSTDRPCSVDSLFPPISYPSSMRVQSIRPDDDAVSPTYPAIVVAEPQRHIPDLATTRRRLLSSASTIRWDAEASSSHGNDCIP